MLNELAENIWISKWADVDVFGFRYPTRMAVIKLQNGDLFIWSPIAFTSDLGSEVNTLGNVAHIIAPNSLHHLSIPDWQNAYPNAAPKLQDKRKDIVFDEDLGNTPNSPWAGEIDQVVFEGNQITTEIVFFHRQSGTILFVDLLQQFPKNWFSGWRKIVARLDKMLAPEPSVPRKFRLAFTNRKVARASFEHIRTWPARIVLMAHGNPVKKDASGFLEKAFKWLKS
ncbi:MAG: DUF4336 domain-containing protein [Hyphomicrobiales bacterium]